MEAIKQNRSELNEWESDELINNSNSLATNKIHWFTEHKHIWRLNQDRPMFVRVKYLLIMELTIATLFAKVFVMRHQMSCCRFLCFSNGLLKNHRTPSSFVASYQRPSAVPVEFHNCNDRVTKVAGKLQVPTMCSGDILLQARGDHLGQIHSDQMVIEMIRRGRLVR